MAQVSAAVDDLTLPKMPKKPKAIPKPRGRKPGIKSKANVSPSSGHSNSPTNDLSGTPRSFKQEQLGEECLFDNDI